MADETGGLKGEGKRGGSLSADYADGDDGEREGEEGILTTKCAKCAKGTKGEGRERVEKMFSWEAVYPMFMKMYGEVLRKG